MSKISGRKVVSTLLSFILSVVIFFIGALSALSVGVLNENKLLKSVLCEQMYSGVRDNIISQAQTLAIPSGISEDIFSDIFTQDVIKTDVDNYFNSVIGEKTYSYDSTKLTAELIKAVEEDLKNDGIKDTSEYRDDIEFFAEEVVIVYERTIEINYLNYYTQIRKLIVPYIPYAYAVLFVLVIIIVLVLFKLYRFKLIHKVERALAYALGGGAIMICAPALFMRFWGIYKRLQLSPEYIYNIFVDYVSSCLACFEIVSAIVLALCILFVVLSIVHRKKVKQRYLNSLRAERLYRHSDAYDDGEDFESYAQPRLVNKDSFQKQAQEYSHYKKYGEEQNTED